MNVASYDAAALIQGRTMKPVSFVAEEVDDAAKQLLADLHGFTRRDDGAQFQQCLYSRGVIAIKSPFGKFFYALDVLKLCASVDGSDEVDLPMFCALIAAAAVAITSAMSAAAKFNLNVGIATTGWRSPTITFEFFYDQKKSQVSLYFFKDASANIGATRRVTSDRMLEAMTHEVERVRDRLHSLGGVICSTQEAESDVGQ